MLSRFLILNLSFLEYGVVKDQCHTDVKELSHNVKQFALALSNFLHLKSFCALDEYFNNTKI